MFILLYLSAMKIKLLLLLFIMPGATGMAAFAQQVPPQFSGRIYLVRHAEKDTVGKNPSLSAAGRKRAGDLYRLLKEKHIGKIYTTRYLRTQMTADSLRIYQQTDTAFYKADTSNAELINKILSGKKGINILIIGHSNTIPALVRMLGGALDMKDLPDNAYDNIFILERKKRKVKLKQEKYGDPSAAQVQQTRMNL
ncbi:MAG: hypothetical protein JWQ27_2764 [Ferruginibacter sp.]|nr:hypothetical protein [Ferruginibacter sp.]